MAGLSAALKVQIRNLELDLEHINTTQQAQFVGYVWGLCDVMAQHAGFKSSSEISQGMFAGVMKMLQLMDSEQALALLETQASEQSDEFIAGLRAGGEDATLLRGEESGMPGFSACFSE